MSRKSMMHFAEYMLSRSEFLQENCQDLEDYRDPECLIPIFMLGYFGGQIAKRYDTIVPDEWALLSALIEEGLASDDDDVGTAVATGLIEGLIHRAEAIEGLWPRIEARLGSEARGYADAYRNADYSVKIKDSTK
jgi:hypothetical protein